MLEKLIKFLFCVAAVAITIASLSVLGITIDTIIPTTEEKIFSGAYYKNQKRNTQKFVFNAIFEVPANERSKKAFTMYNTYLRKSLNPDHLSKHKIDYIIFTIASLETYLSLLHKNESYAYCEGMDNLMDMALAYVAITKKSDASTHDITDVLSQQQIDSIIDNNIMRLEELIGLWPHETEISGRYHQIKRYLLYASTNKHLEVLTFIKEKNIKMILSE